MYKIALTAVASAVILCSGSMVSDRAEAMILGSTAAGVRVAVQDISSIGAIHYRRHYHYGYGDAPWYWPTGPAPYYVRGEVGVRYGNWCWRETDGARPFGYYRECPRR